MKFPATITLGLATLLLPGCIVQEMRDDLHSTSQQLGEVRTSLTQVNSLLESTNQRLDKVEASLGKLNQTNTLLDDVQTGMGRIDTTNKSLDNLQSQLALLQSIETSLGRLDTHLTALRKTLGSLDSFIPFVDLTGGEEVADKPAESAESTPAVAASDAPADPSAAPTPAPAKDQPAATKTPAGSDWLIGIWVRAYPDDTTAIVFLKDGTFALSTISSAGESSVDRGTWTRAADRLELTFTPRAEPAPAAHSTPADAPAAAPAPAAPTSITYRILSGSSRALAVETDRGISVFNRQ